MSARPGTESEVATTPAAASAAADISPMSLSDLHVNQQWRRLAACRNMDTTLFYLDREGRDGHRGYNPEALATCRSCPVRKACLDFALANREEFGLWGGTIPRERQKMLRGKAVCSGCHGLFKRASRGQQYYCPDCHATRSA